MIERTAVGPGQAAPEIMLEAYRAELTGHCYRMLGSAFEAEDAVQDTLVRAWRAYDRFEGRAALRSWLYKIATNVCLDMLSSAQRRARPMELGSAGSVGSLPEAPLPETVWVGPAPDDRVLPERSDPADLAVARESIRLAFVAALQHLPPRQRAVLILREVLSWSASEVAELLGTTVASVNSALQRARATVDERIPDVSQAAELDALGEDGRRELVDAFVSAWERADVDGITRLLAQDARFTMPPLPAWFDGRDAVMRFVAGRNFETPWRLVSLRPYGTPAFACYQSVDGGPFTLGAVMTLILRDGLVTEIASFLDPALYRHLGLPAHA
jgi:RNA polymerase sigma-70 factor (TIGR02960 family)